MPNNFSSYTQWALQKFCPFSGIQLQAGLSHFLDSDTRFLLDDDVGKHVFVMQWKPVSLSLTLN
jgi:hypothetical protein